jgi:hypothetical protein
MPWPDISEDLPRDLVAVPMNELGNPLAPPLVVSKEASGDGEAVRWVVKDPTRVEVRNLEELFYEPAVSLEAISERFSLLGTIVSQHTSTQAVILRG